MSINHNLEKIERKKKKIRIDATESANIEKKSTDDNESMATSQDRITERDIPWPYKATFFTFSDSVVPAETFGNARECRRQPSFAFKDKV